MLKPSDVFARNDVCMVCLRKSFALLRFYDLKQLITFENECKDTASKLLSKISSLNFEASVLINNFSDTCLNVLLPKLKDFYELTSGSNKKAEINMTKAMKEDISDFTAKALNIDKAGLDIIADKWKYVSPYTNNPAFRDIDEAVEILVSCSDILESDDTDISEKVNDIQAQETMFTLKFKNACSNHANKLKTLLNKYDELETILGACMIAKILRQRYKLNSVEQARVFLNKNTDELIKMSLNELTDYYNDKGE